MGYLSRLKQDKVEQRLAAPALFAEWRRHFGKLRQEQVVGLEYLYTEIVKHWPETGPGKLAYILATVHWETNQRFEPVREAYYLDMPEAAKEEWRKKNLARYYPYYGRGYVQITWRANYEWLSTLVGVDCVAEPDIALQQDVALKALVVGMLTGRFGKPLGRYFTATKADWVGARQSVNGRDKAARIAAIAEKYYMIVQVAQNG
jgi:Chitinase class I